MALNYTSLTDVSCPSVDRCWAVGCYFTGSTDGLILTSGDGGVTWSYQDSAATPDGVREIDRPSTTRCVIVGLDGLTMSTADGGTSWMTRSSGSSDLTVSILSEDLSAIDCPSASDCWIGAGSSNRMYATHDGGASWLLQPTDGGVNWNAISCPNTTECWGWGWSGGVTGGVASNALVVPAERQVP